jgi:hypothetical protein
MAYPDRSVFTGTDPFGLWFPLLETSTQTWFLVETNGRSFVDMFLGHPRTYPAIWSSADLQQMLERSVPRWSGVREGNLFPSMARTVAARAGASILSWELGLAQRVGASVSFVIPESFWGTSRFMPPYSEMIIENIPFQLRYRRLARPWNAREMPGLETVSDTDPPPVNDISTTAAPRAQPRADFVILGAVSLATAVVSFLAFRRWLR